MHEHKSEIYIDDEAMCYSCWHLRQCTPPDYPWFSCDHRSFFDGMLGSNMKCTGYLPTGFISLYNLMHASGIVELP